MNNLSIKRKAKASGVALWQIADYLNISEATMTRMMRKELTPEKADEICNIIDLLSDSKGGGI